MSLEGILTEKQLNSLSYDNTGGTAWDGVGRKVQVYFLGNENMTLDEPYAMTWNADCSTVDEDMKTYLADKGFIPMVDAPYSCYNIDVQSYALNMVFGTEKYKMCIVKTG